MEPLSKLTDLLTLSGWRAGSLGLAALLFILSSRVGLLPKIGDEVTLVVASIGFIGLGLGCASAAQAIASEISAWRSRRRRAQQIKEHKETFCRDIMTFSEVERAIFGCLRSRNTRSFTADPTGDRASTLIGRGYIERSTRPGQMVSMQDAPFVIPEHIWQVVVQRPDDFPWREEDHLGRRGARPPWRSVF